MEKPVLVTAYSGYKLNERPIRILLNDTKLEVEQILKRWRDEEYECFKILTNDGNIYTLKWHRTEDMWILKKES